MYEVEQKFPLGNSPPVAAQLEAKLAALGVSPGEPCEQHDTYFAHPSRDFGLTDEALRIRRLGRERRITYKGPKLDAETKTRREIELPLAPLPENPDSTANTDDYPQLLAALGFSRVLDVHKTRRTGQLQWQGRAFEIALDEVRGLGRFVELETVTGEDDLPAARAALASLSAELGLQQVERRSYLELLQEATI